jgi:hypothetical protein
MPHLTFYRQKRIDGGIRMGLELDQETLFEEFEEGGPESDPVLVWYVDLRCDGPGVPGTAAAAWSWLLDNEDRIVEGFWKCAREYLTGIDPDAYPLLWSDFPNPPPDVRLTIAYAALRRLDGRALVAVLNDVAEHWAERIRGMNPAVVDESTR